MTDCKLPLCFFTKKNGAAIGLVDGQIFNQLGIDSGSAVPSSGIMSKI